MWPSHTKLLVVSPGFAFRGPLAAAFLKSFHHGLKVYGCAANALGPMPEVTHRMLWESFLEDISFSILPPEEALAQYWDAVVEVAEAPGIDLDGLVSGTLLKMQIPALISDDLALARALRDRIKNEAFKLLRDRLKLKPGS